MLKAGALYYAIFLSFIISLFSGLLILGVWSHHMHTLNLIQQMQLQRNVHSSIRVAMETPGEAIDGQSHTLNLYNDSSSEVQLTRRFWGGYVLLKSQAIWRHLHYASIALCGNDISNEEPIALYLADKNRYLSISGSTMLRGMCYLPKLGIRSAYIEGMSFTETKLIDGSQKQSAPELPDINMSVVDAMSEMMKGKTLAEDSLVAITLLLKSDSLVNSFYNKTVVLYSDHWITLSHLSLKGNIKIISKRGITIDHTAKLIDIVLLAPKIELAPHVTGNAQFFVRDTLLVGEGTTLRFPSLLALLADGCNKPLIQIEKHVKLLGDVILRSSLAPPKAECRIAEDAEIQGKVYCQGKVELKGRIFGSLYCNGFVLHTPTSVYENNLLNATVDYTSLPSPYAGSLFFMDAPHYKQVKWEY